LNDFSEDLTVTWAPTSLDIFVIIWTDVFVIWMGSNFRMVGGVIVPKDAFTIFFIVITIF